jgi:hypothetical protein
MVPPDGARTKLPTLSWDSVVDDAPPSPPVAGDPSADAVPEADGGAITLAPMSLDLAVPPPPASDLGALVTPSSGAGSSDLEIEPLVVRTTPPTVIVPAIGDVISGPESFSDPTHAPGRTAPTVPPTSGSAAPPPPDPFGRPVASTPPPVTAEATAAPTPPASTAPEPSVASDAVVVDRVDGALPTIQEATPIEPVAPLLPTLAAHAPAPSSSPSTPAASFDFHAASMTPAPSPRPRPRSSRRGLKLVVVLLLLGGLIAGGLVIGQPYLFPGDWDATTAPYAEAVEVAGGVEFNEPFAIVAEPTAEFGARLAAQVGPGSAEQLAQWRALGLVSGAVDESTIAGQLAGWQGAFYSTTDGQVYHDDAIAGPELDVQLVQQVAAASLDQQYGWSAAQARRSLDGAAATSAEVLRQSRTIQEASTFAGAAPTVPVELVDALPPVVGYRALAPHVFAEFEGRLDATEANALSDLGTAGPGHLGRDTPAVAASSTVTEGDVATAAPAAKDRSFWYLVFAGYLDARTAHAASEAVVESALTPVDRNGTTCMSATFAGTGVEQTATLRSALEAWVASAPVEMGPTFQVLPDGTLQLVACDPGAGFDARMRPGVARELLAWRMAELATLEAVAYGGGDETQFTDAWTFVAASPMALELMALPPTTSPADLAVAARTGFDALFASAG